MSNVMDRLQSARRKLENAEKEKIAIEAKIGVLMEQLADEGYSNVAAASEALENMEKTISEMEDTLEGMLNEFESKYDSLLEE